VLRGHAERGRDAFAVDQLLDDVEQVRVQSALAVQRVVRGLVAAHDRRERQLEARV
jgi:hypothetical protein